MYGPGAIIKKQRANLKWDKEDETLALNLKYTSKAIRVELIPKGGGVKKAAAGQGGDDDKMNAAIMKERNMVIQGNIVKIMKTNQGHAVTH